MARGLIAREDAGPKRHPLDGATGASPTASSTHHPRHLRSHFLNGAHQGGHRCSLLGNKADVPFTILGHGSSDAQQVSRSSGTSNPWLYSSKPPTRLRPSSRCAASGSPRGPTFDPSAPSSRVRARHASRAGRASWISRRHEHRAR